MTGARVAHQCRRALLIDYNLESRRRPAPPAGRFYRPTPYRASDHDPVAVGLNLVHAINGTAGADVIVGTPGDGGAAAAAMAAAAARPPPDGQRRTRRLRLHVDARRRRHPHRLFAGDDRLDLSALLAGIGATPATAWASGVVTLAASGNNTVVLVDRGIQRLLNWCGREGLEPPRDFSR